MVLYYKKKRKKNKKNKNNKKKDCNTTIRVNESTVNSINTSIKRCT